MNIIRFFSIRHFSNDNYSFSSKQLFHPTCPMRLEYAPCMLLKTTLLRMAELKVAFWNCAGLRADTSSTAQKLMYFSSQYADNTLDIIAFLETHHKDDSEIPLQLQALSHNYSVIHTPTPPHHTHSGIMVFITKKYNVIRQQEVIAGRLLNVQIKDPDYPTEFNISFFYGPQTRSMNKPELNAMLNTIANTHPNHENNIILGDFNFIDNDLDKTKGMDGRDKLLLKEWQDLLTHTDMRDPYRRLNPNRRYYSFRSSSGKSRVDRVYIAKRAYKLSSSIVIRIPLLKLHMP